VIVSFYQAERFLPARLENLVGQTCFSQCEILLYDAATPEGESAIATEYAQKHANIRYTYLDQRESIYAVWNRGVLEAKGDYITNANADDLLRSDALETLAAFLDRHPAVDLAYPDYWVTHQPAVSFADHVRSGYAKRAEFAPEIMRFGCFMGPMPMWRKSLHERFGLFDENLSAAGDYEFWCRCVACGSSFSRVAQFLGLYLHNPTGICNSDIPRVEKESAAVRTRYAQLLPPTRTRPEYQDFYACSQRFGEDRFVNICVVTYNRLAFTRQCLQSVWEHTRYPYRLTVVDNASTDGTPEYLTELQRQGVIHNLYLLPKNLGVAKAANIAWQAEPQASATLKLDNDIVVKKDSWLEDMMAVLEQVPDIGILAYNVEPVSYPASSINGFNVRVKSKANVGGATALIPRGTCELLGYWCEEFALYGEEDADYGARVRLAGLLNVYMEDENAMFHLPAGKAAAIAMDSLEARDGQEEEQDRNYRDWKDQERRRNLDDPKSAFHRNLAGYVDGWMPFYKSGFCGWSFHHASATGLPDCGILFPLTSSRPNWFPSLRLLCEHASPRPSVVIVVLPENLADPDLDKAASLSSVRLLRIPGHPDRAELLRQGSLACHATWCAVVEPGLSPAPGWNGELVATALSEKAGRVQGTVWQDFQVLTQPRPWPWFFVCKTDLLQRPAPAFAVYLSCGTAARTLPHVGLD